MRVGRDREAFPRGMPLADRLAARSERREDGCVVWTGTPHDDMGYCRMSNGHGRMTYVHVLAWELASGRPVPDGMVVRHTCDNPPCVNPDHLVLGTQKDNVADMHARGRADRRGERNNQARLGWPAVREIRRRHAAGETIRALARSYDVSESQVSNIIHHRHWKETA